MRAPEDFQHHTADLAAMRIHYVREGAGAPLLLAHGWPGFWWEWHKVIGPLAESFDVIVPDMRGFGDSENPPLDQVEPFRIDHAVEDTRQLLDHLGIEKAYLVGHDFGSELVHKFIRRHPDQVAGVAIFNPIVPGFEENYMSRVHFRESWYAMFHRIDMAAELVASSREACRIYFTHFLRHWSSDGGAFTDAMIDHYVDNYQKPGNIRAGFNFYRPSRPWDDIDRTPYRRPVLFLQGEDDPCIPAKWLHLVEDWYTEYSLERVPDAGHFLMIEQPELVIDRLRGHFGQQP